MLSVSSSYLQASLTSGLWTVGNMLVHVNAEGKNDGSYFITKLHNGIRRWWLPWDATLLWIKHIIKEAWPGTWNNCSYFWFSYLKQGYWKDHMLKNTSDAAVINSFPPIHNLPCFTHLKPPHVTNPRPGPAKIRLPGPEWVNAEQLEAIQPFRVLS